VKVYYPLFFAGLFLMVLSILFGLSGCYRNPYYASVSERKPFINVSVVTTGYSTDQGAYIIPCNVDNCGKQP